MMNRQLAWRITVLWLSLITTGFAAAQDQFADLPDPTRPTSPWGTAIGTVNKTVKLTLESTIVSGERRLAIINGKTLGVGALIEGARIKDIAPYQVQLERNGRIVTLKLVADNFIRPRQQMGARQ